MARTPKRQLQRSAKLQEPPLPRLKRFRPVSWYDDFAVRSVDDYISHMLTELGRLGMGVSDIESYDRPPNTERVLSDLLKWLSSHPGKEYGQLVDWRTLDIEQMRARLEKDRDAKPRIEVSAEITRMNNLSVRWHPGGWKNSSIDWQRGGSSHHNLIPHRRWRESPDFHWFTGDEDPYFDSRPSNELMFVRGVGNLRPTPVETYGPYATYNSDVVDSILICAVRAAYEGLVEQLAHNFEVTVLDAFDFVIRDEFDEADTSPFRHAIHRVATWTLEDAAALNERRERKRAERQLKEDLAALESMPTTYGLMPEDFVAALVAASMRKRTGPPPSGENTNRNAAKSLRAAGHALDAGQVRHLRQLIERYRPELLPESLQPVPATPPTATSAEPGNVVKFRKED